MTLPEPVSPMSSNRLRARLVFSFKGETHELDSVIDLDAYPCDPEHAPDFHLLLARAGAIDPYSYLYEAMASHEIAFSEATGLAAACCDANGFDWPRYAGQRQAADDMKIVGDIARRLLGIDVLDRHADVKAALLAAYRAGKGG